jgi:GxxExxY protein
MADVRREDLLYPDLSYKIVDTLFDVYYKLGAGHYEKYYQNAVAVAFDEKGISYKREHHIPLKLRTKKIGSYFLDFLVEDKVVLELKKGNFFPRTNIDQIYAYLKATSLQLGILANYTSSGVKCKRIVNISTQDDER